MTRLTCPIIKSSVQVPGFPLARHGWTDTCETIAHFSPALPDSGLGPINGAASTAPSVSRANGLTAAAAAGEKMQEKSPTVGTEYSYSVRIVLGANDSAPLTLLSWRQSGLRSPISRERKGAANDRA